MKVAAEDLRLAAVAFESHDSMMITDHKGTILRVNGGFTTMTGYAAEDVIGHTPRILKSGRRSRTFYENMWSAIRTNGFWRGELWNRRQDGRVYPQRLTITSVKNELGKTTHYVGDGHDITEEKQAEVDRQVHRHSAKSTAGSSSIRCTSCAWFRYRRGRVSGRPREWRLL